MQIGLLQVRNLRNLVELDLELDPGLNVFWGPNGCGKTAILEAVFVLGRARSFRTSRLSDLPRHGSPGFHVVAHGRSDREGSIVTGITREGSDVQIRYLGQPVKKISTHTRRFPVAVATPASQDFVYGAPKVRRKWLDWGLFHVEPAYLGLWKNYHTLMRHRNKLLYGSTRSGELDAFEGEMSVVSETINEIRGRFVSHIKKQVECVAAATGYPGINLSLEPGWDASLPLSEVLKESREQDAVAGFSRVGPHRVDLSLVYQDRDAAAVLSRGQSKFLVLLLTVAMALAIDELGGERPILLLDDPTAELDAPSQAVFLKFLAGQPCQCLVTLPGEHNRIAELETGAWFHVKPGEIGKMIEFSDR
jgi:DNA replication and repair protein RecF